MTRSYDTGEIVTEIQGAEHSGRDLGSNNGEWVTLNQLDDDQYEVELVGSDTHQGGTSSSTVQTTNDDGIEFTLDVTEVPLQPAELTSQISTINPNAQATETASTSISFEEANGDQSLEDLTVTTSDLSHVDDESTIGANSISVSEEMLSIPAGEREQLGVTVHVPEGAAIGEYEGIITVENDEQSLAIVIDLSVPLSVDLVKYAKTDNKVTTEGLREAIEDWRTDDIGTDLLREAIEAWRSDDSVV